MFPGLAYASTLLVALSSFAIAQQPINETFQQPSGSSGNDVPVYLFVGSASNYSLAFQNTSQVESIRDAANFNRSGAVGIATPSKGLQNLAGAIALISCDTDSGDYSIAGTSLEGFIETVAALVFGNNTTNDGAVILFSNRSNACVYNNYSPPQAIAPFYNRMFTLTSASDAASLTGMLSQSNSSNVPGYVAAFSGSSQSNGGNNASPTSQNMASSSTTIAMVVLYSITGVITLLFLSVIVLGAMRAQRHPERYGPRNMLGMPRQSRARGMARAMLDTIPIVNFGESEQTQSAEAASKDIELANRSAGASAGAGAGTRTAVGAGASDVRRGTTSSDKAIEADPTGDNEGIGAIHPVPAAEARQLEDAENEMPATVPGAATVQIEAAAAHAPDTLEEGSVSCPICTEDFVRGEPARLLPCHHHFHPACIDPWLLNVSSTCPLCRIELNPPEEDEGGAQMEAVSNNVTQWPYTNRLTAGNTGRRSRPLFSGLGILSLTHLSQASPQERLEALRQFRAARQARDRQNGESGNGRRNRISRIFHRHPPAEQDASGSTQPAPVDQA